MARRVARTLPAALSVALGLSQTVPARAQTSELSQSTSESGEEEGPRGPRVPWRGTGLGWTHSASTTMLGVGRSNLGSDSEAYTQSLRLLLNYYVVDAVAFRLRLSTSPAVDLELTNSDTTTREREPQWRDLPLTATATTRLARSADRRMATLIIPSASLIFPASKQSRAVGNLLTSSLRLTLEEVAQVAPEVVVAGAVSGRWDHRFNRATEPVDPDLDWPRQSTSGTPVLSDQLTGIPLAHDSLRTAGFGVVEHGAGPTWLWWVVGGFLTWDWVSGFEDDPCIETLTGCVEIRRLDEPFTTRVSTGFSAEVYWFPVVDFAIQLGYVNQAGQLGPDGQQRNPFYSPAATFDASILLAIDALYERLTGPPREVPFLLL